MNKETRGNIEKLFGTIPPNVVSGIRWVESEIPISSMRDLTLGYVIGSLKSLATASVTFSEGKICSEEDDNEINSILRRRLPEFVSIIERDLHR